MEKYNPAENMDKRLHDLAAQCRELGSELTRQGKAAEEGFPPDRQLIKEMDCFLSLFESTQEMIMQLCQRYHLLVPELCSTCDTARLTQLWEQIKPLLKAEQEASEIPAMPAVPDADEAAVLLKLIEDVILENKLTPAYWLSAYFGLIYKVDPPVPAVWLKMIEISRLVTEQHQIAVQALARFYRESASSCLGDPIMQWLAFAAALLPGIHAPSSGARDLLQNLDTLPCSLKKLVSLLLETPQVDSRLESLAGEARQWLDANRQIYDLASPLAPRLWAAMLEDNGIIARLLTPVIEIDQTRREAVGNLAGYLEDEACQRKELAMQYRILLKKYGILLKDQEDSALYDLHISGSGIILNRLRDALTLSMRWLEILNNYKIFSDGDGSGAPGETLHTAVQNAAASLQSFSMQHRGSNLFLALTLARHSLDLLADSLTNQLGAANQESAALAADHSVLLEEAGILPDHQAVARIGAAIFNYFRSTLVRSLTQQHSLPGKNADNLLDSDNSGTAPETDNPVPAQKEDFSKKMQNN